jgi:hypothetical protein
MAKGKPHTWQRTAKYYREKGYFVEKTEYTSRGLRHDLCGFIDGMAWGIGERLCLQACGGSDFAEHKRKILGPCRAKAMRVLLSGDRIVLIGWRKLKPRGVKVGRWTPRIEEITLKDFV